jgi:hypothetical protein
MVRNNARTQRRLQLCEEIAHLLLISIQYYLLLNSYKLYRKRLSRLLFALPSILIRDSCTQAAIHRILDCVEYERLKVISQIPVQIGHTMVLVPYLTRLACEEHNTIRDLLLIPAIYIWSQSKY